jgi:hypothetical protein
MVIEDLVNAIKDLFFTFLYRCFSLICVLVDFIKDIFYMLCGIDPVEIEGEDTDLLSSLIQSDSIRRVFLMVFVIGAILLVVFTIIAIIKTSYQEKTNWVSVLKKSGQSFIIAVLIPFTVLAGIVLTNTVMRSINIAMNPYGGSSSATIGGEFLATIGSDAFIGEDKDAVIAKFVSGEYDYNNIDLVKRYFNLENVNYLIGILGSFVMLVMFVLSSINFVQRIFDIVLLYIVSPISIATIPLDEGNRFKVWKDMMVGKILSAYGIILTMNLFFLVIPQVYKIRFFEGDFQNGVVYVLFLIGGSFAVSKASDIISRLCGSEQGRNELSSMLYNVRSGFALAHSVKNVAGKSIGRFVGGNAYNKSRSRGASRTEALKSSAKNNVNETRIDPAKRKKRGAIAKSVGALTRFATMPAGMIHDLAQGGVVGMGKNFLPRLDNAVHGSSALSHADVKAPTKRDKNARSEAKGGKKENARKDFPKKGNSVMRKDDSERKTLGRNGRKSKR